MTGLPFHVLARTSPRSHLACTTFLADSRLSVQGDSVFEFIEIVSSGIFRHFCRLYRLVCKEKVHIDLYVSGLSAKKFI